VVTFVIKSTPFSLAFRHGRRKPWNAPYSVVGNGVTFVFREPELVGRVAGHAPPNPPVATSDTSGVIILAEGPTSRIFLGSRHWMRRGYVRILGGARRSPDGQTEQYRTQ
jgi:hypothetical protein